MAQLNAMLREASEQDIGRRARWKPQMARSRLRHLS
jgi:hypothetical protein